MIQDVHKLKKDAISEGLELSDHQCAEILARKNGDYDADYDAVKKYLEVSCLLMSALDFNVCA